MAENHREFVVFFLLTAHNYYGIHKDTVLWEFLGYQINEQRVFQVNNEYSRDFQVKTLYICHNVLTMM